MFLSDAQIKTSLAAHLKQDADDLDMNVWGPILGRAHQAAYQEILGKLLARSFTIDQINSFDSGAFYEESITLFFLAARGSFGESYDLTAAKLLDKRADLVTCQVFIGGKWVKPLEGASGPGTVNTGPQKTSGCSTFGDSVSDIRW